MTDLPGDAIDMSVDHLPRRAILPPWLKAMTASAMVLAAASILFSVVLYGQVQDERSRAALLSCRESNMRNHDTKRRLDVGYAVMRKRAPAQGKQLEESRAFTVLLIDALQPRRDCAVLVKDRVAR